MASPYKPINDLMVEKILQIGEYINDNGARFSGLKVIKVKCDKCFAVGIPASFRWNDLDVCLLCAHKHKMRDMEIINDGSEAYYKPLHEPETKLKLQEILSKFIEQKIHTDDSSFVPSLVSIAFSTLRFTLPSTFWEYGDQNIINTFNGFMERMRDRFIDTFGTEYLAKVYKIAYEKEHGPDPEED